MSRGRSAPLLAAVTACLLLPAFADAATIRPDVRFDEHGSDADNGNCTLREAVMSANDDTSEDACTKGDGADRIVLQGGTYTLSVAGGDSNNGIKEADDRIGDLDLDSVEKIQLIGHKNGTTIDAAGIDRVIDVIGTDAVLRRLTLTGGAPAYNGGAGIDIDFGAKVLVVDSMIAGNTAPSPISGDASAARVVSEGSRLTLRRTLVRDNDGRGTALTASSDATLIVDETRLDRNDSTSTSGGGAISLFLGASASITDSVIAGNSAGPFGDGGGLSTSDSKVTIERSRITGNSGRDGGGIDVSDSEVTIRNSEISGNSADDAGGGISTSNLPVLTVINTTISNNTAYADEVYDSGSYEDGGGLALVGAAADTTIVNSTIANNHAYRGGGVIGGFSGLPTFKGTLIANNTSAHHPDSPDCFGDIASEGNNLFGHIFIDETLCTVSPLGSDKVNVPAKIRGLADNGGPTRTHALRPGSKAINNGPGNAPKTDQRGVKRNNPDIGAYEVARCGGVIVNRVGTDGRDYLRGTNGADGFLTFGGNDRVSARGGNDGVCAGGGRDRIDGGPGRDFCDGGPGRDRATACERQKRIP